MGILSLRNFSKKYGDRQILAIPQFQFDEGVHWIKGENGAGKSTLFQSIAGIIPFEGDILLDGQFHPRKHMQDYKRYINYSEAEPLYPETLLGSELIQWVAKAKQSQPTDTQKMLTLWGIDEFMHQPCRTYSSGMAKKLSLALAFLGKQQWIILDEPLITLDTTSLEKLETLIATKKKEGVSFLLASHQKIAASLITHSWELKNKSLSPL